MGETDLLDLKVGWRCIYYKKTENCLTSIKLDISGVNLMLNHLNHKHVIFKCDMDQPPQTELQVYRWIEAIVENIEMKIFLGPYVKRCETEGNEGLTGICVIETSHLAMHVWDGCPQPYAQIDLYSCKDFNYGVVVDSLKVLYGAKNFEILELDRNNNLKIEGKRGEIGGSGEGELLYWGC